MPININISAKTMEGVGAIDPEVTINILQTEPLQEQIERVTIQNFNGSCVVTLDTPEGIFPTWQVSASFSRFDVDSGFFFQPMGNANPSHTFLVQRLPGAWTPQFTPLAILPSPRFDRLKAVIAGSDSVDLKLGPPVGNLETNYDAMSGDAQILAKAALLNLYAVLTDEVDPTVQPPVCWFSYVRKIVRLDSERFVAEVDPTLYENVQTIISELGVKYSAQKFSTEPPADSPLHIPNIPTSYHSDANLVHMITVKKQYEQGDVQLTMSFLRVNGQAVHLLDCDMDEHDNIVGHSFDLIKHLISRSGTSPIAMHEYIEKDSSDANGGVLSGGTSTVDLGYILV
jgi:hypothetical protein